MASNADETTAGPRAGGNGWVFLLSVVVAFTVVATVGVSVAAIGLTESDPGRSAATQTLDGAEIYSTYCARCHGDGGEGGIGPSLAGVVDTYPDASVQAVVVATGRNAMPSFRSTLSAEQIDAVVDYERTAFGELPAAE